MFRSGSTRRTRCLHFYFRISHIKKAINENHLRKNDDFHLTTSGAKTIHLRSNLIKNVTGHEESLQCFLILPSYHA